MAATTTTTNNNTTTTTTNANTDVDDILETALLVIGVCGDLGVPTGASVGGNFVEPHGARERGNFAEPCWAEHGKSIDERRCCEGVGSLWLGAPGGRRARLKWHGCLRWVSSHPATKRQS